MAPPIFVRADVWSDLACFSGIRQAFLDDIRTLTATRSVDNRDELTLEIGRTNRALPFLVKLAVIRLVFSDTTFDEEWRITGITQDQVKGTYVVTCDWPLIDLATRATLCSTPSLTTDDQAPYAFEAIGLTAAQHFDNYVMRGFPAAWSGKVGRGTFDVATPQDLVYDWDKPRKIIGDLAQLTNTEISYRRNGSASYLVDLLTAIGSAAPVLDVRLGKNIAGITVKEDENQRATTVYPRSALVDGVSYGLAQNRWKIAAMNAGAKTIDLVDPAGKAGPIAFDGQFGTTGLAWRVFKANGPPVSASNRIITTSTVANQRLTVSVDPTLIFAVNDLLCFGDIDGSSNYVPIWSLNDGPQAIADPPVAVLKRDDVVAGVNLVPNPLMRTWSGGAGTPPDQWINNAATLTKRTTPADYQSGGQSCRVQTTASGQGLTTALFGVTAGNQQATGFVRFRIDALTGGAKVKVQVYCEYGTSPIVVNIYPNTWGAAQSAADSDKIGLWVTLSISATMLVERARLEIAQDGTGTADFTVDAAQFTLTSYQLPLIEGASGNVLWQAANDLITTQRGAQREYAVDLIDLASADPTAFPYDQIQLGQTLRVTDADVGASAVSLRLLSLTREHITDGALTPAKVRVQVGVLAPSGAGLLAGSTLNGRQGPVSAVSGSGSRIGNAPVIPPDFSSATGLGFYNFTDPAYGAVAGAGLTTQHVAINNAIIAANAAGGGTVFGPPGIYMIDPDHVSGASVRLLDNVTLWLPAGCELRAIATGLDLYSVVYGLSKANVAIIGEGIINGNRAAHIGATGQSGMCVLLYGCDGVKLRDFQAINGWGDGVYLGDAGGTTPNTNVDMRGVVCDGNRRNGCSVVGVKAGVIDSCWFLNTSGTSPQAGIDLEPNVSGNVDGVTVSNCVSLDNAGPAVNFTTSTKNCRIHHHYGARCATGGILIGATGGGNLIDHNTMADFTAATRGIYDVGSGTVGCRLLGNEARNIATTFQAYYVHSTATGIEVLDNKATGVTAAEGFTINAPDCIVDGNVAEDIGAIGIDIAASADRCHVCNNTVLRSVGRGFYIAGADCQMLANTAVDVSAVSGAIFQFPAGATGAQAIGNRAILTTPNTAIVPFLFTATPSIKAGNLGIGTQAYTETLDGTLSTAAQPNVTSLGTLTSLAVSGTAAVGVLQAGTNPASAGIVKIPNATNVAARNAANSGDVNMLSVSAADNLSVGSAAAAALLLTAGASGLWIVAGADGSLGPNADNTYDIGLSASKRPRTGYFGTSLRTPRFVGTGTAHVAGDYALSAGWGTTATVSAVAAKDTGGRVTIASTGTGQAANPTITLTWKDGTWTTVPAVVVSRGDTAAAAGDFRNTTPGATTMVITFVGTPVAGQTYILDFVATGK